MENEKKSTNGIQDAVQTVELFEGFGLLEKVPKLEIKYKKQPYEEGNRVIESKAKEPVRIDLWRWSGSMEVDI